MRGLNSLCLVSLIFKWSFHQLEISNPLWARTIKSSSSHTNTLTSFRYNSMVHIGSRKFHRMVQDYTAIIVESKRSQITANVLYRVTYMRQDIAIWS